MKNIYKLLFLSSIAAIVLWSCKKDENRDYFQGGTPPVLSASTNASADAVSLVYADAAKQALSLSWTNPNYQFTTGISSQDVQYTVEIDTAGANFTNPNKKQLVISKDLSVTMLESELNDYMLNQLALKPNMEHSLELRVIASLKGNAVALTSNVVPLKATPYSIPPKVKLPVNGELFLVGSATPGGDAHGWDNPVPVPSQQFTQVSETQYEITIDLIGGKEYLFIPVNGDWSHKYAVKDKTVGGLSDGGDFGYDLGDNFPGPAVSGTYKISVDFQRGKFTVTKQ